MLPTVVVFVVGNVVVVVVAVAAMSAASIDCVSSRKRTYHCDEICGFLISFWKLRLYTVRSETGRCGAVKSVESVC